MNIDLLFLDELNAQKVFRLVFLIDAHVDNVKIGDH
jgi:hypothetical protein